MSQLEHEQTIRSLRGMQWVRTCHGSLYDRGGADSYYGRPAMPHYGGVGGSQLLVRVTDLTPEERAEYMAGYQDNEELGDKKSWD